MPGTPPEWIKKLHSRFIAFDGPDGCGKTTQFHMFSRLVQSAGLGLCAVREPGGTPIGEKIRQILLDPANADMDQRCEMLLYMASRAQLCADRINPALAAGDFVLADRFVSSTLAYQGTLGGMSKADILVVAQIALHWAWPDIVVIFDVDEGTATRRLMGLQKGTKNQPKATGPSLFSDRMEIKGSDSFEPLRQAYLEQAADHPGAYVVVDGAGDPETVFDKLLAAVERKALQW